MKFSLFALTKFTRKAHNDKTLVILTCVLSYFVISCHTELS